jgi:4-alpha-glucanotransferase
MTASRSSGVLLHVTSLPGPFGIGDLGAEACDFVDFLARTGQTVWQVLPIGPAGFGNSPYQSPSAFAGNPLLIDLRQLHQEGLLDDEDLADGEELTSAPVFGRSTVDFDRVTAWRMAKLARAFERFNGLAGVPFRARYNTFCDRNAAWLDDYTLFMAIKEAHGGREWTAWESDLVRRDKAALKRASRKLARSVQFRRFLQFVFFEQWSALRDYAQSHNVRILGDVPIFVAHDSADVWANQELYFLDDAGQPTVVAGVPPDYFSATGQRWGNPLYRWDVLKKTGYDWWLKRLERSFHLYDQVRIDHFRAFESYWEIPATEETAVLGQWLPGPGAAFFKTVARKLGTLNLIAEDLGLITPAVEALRDEVGFPGMRVLQFAFGDDSTANHRPYTYPQRCVVYTGTHDNDTTCGWFHRTAEPGGVQTAAELAAEREFALKFLGTDGHEIHWDMIRAALSSVAELAIVPIQDLLGLGSEARMNTPGTGVNNWGWKLTPGQITPDVETRLRELTRLYGRAPHLADAAAAIEPASPHATSSAA